MKDYQKEIKEDKVEMIGFIGETPFVLGTGTGDTINEEDVYNFLEKFGESIFEYDVIYCVNKDERTARFVVYISSKEDMYNICMNDEDIKKELMELGALPTRAEDIHFIDCAFVDCVESDAHVWYAEVMGFDVDKYMDSLWKYGV